MFAHWGRRHREARIWSALFTDDRPSRSSQPRDGHRLLKATILPSVHRRQEGSSVALKEADVDAATRGLGGGGEHGCPITHNTVSWHSATNPCPMTVTRLPAGPDTGSTPLPHDPLPQSSRRARGSASFDFSTRRDAVLFVLTAFGLHEVRQEAQGGAVGRRPKPLPGRPARTARRIQFRELDGPSSGRRPNRAAAESRPCRTGTQPTALPRPTAGMFV
jgi:hypothetical protein